MLYLLSKFVWQKDRIISAKLHQFRIFAYDYPTLIHLYEEIFIDEVYSAPLTSLSPLIIDGGANIGMATLYFKLIYPNCRVLTFEPGPDAFELLSRNVDANKLTDVSIFNFALSGSDGETDFYLPKKKGSLNSTSQQRLGDRLWHSVRVKTRKLSTLITDKKIDLIKLDLEGDEDKVLTDLISSNLIEQVLNLIVEFHQIIHPQIFFLEISRKFEALGFSTALVTTSTSSFSDAFDLILSFRRRKANA